MLNNPDALIEALQAYKAERMQRMALEAENAVQKQQLIEMQPKASYYNVVLNSPDLVSITEISKDYGWSAQKMNEYLHRQGIQFKQGGKNLDPLSEVCGKRLYQHQDTYLSCHRRKHSYKGSYLLDSEGQTFHL